MSILSGIGDLVDAWLQVEPKGKPPYYRHRAAANALTRRDSPINGARDFLAASYAQIHTTWLAASDAGLSRQSKENWRWKRHLDLGDGNKSPELKLERAIVGACGDNWSNQMPTASGLVGPAANRRAAVDLVLREDSSTYSLIELKIASDTPLFAAIEILMYGLLFVWSKNNWEKLGYDVEAQPVLAANTVTLGVLAPSSYYDGFDLTTLASALDSGLNVFGKQHELKLGFEFCELGADYSPDLKPEHIRSAISNRSSVGSVK
jgi:hypothetical protein